MDFTLRTRNALIFALTTLSCAEGTTDPAPVAATLAIEPDSALLALGDSLQLSATALSEDGDTIAVRVSWHSDLPSRAVVNARGWVQPLDTGWVVITASADTSAANVSIRVTRSTGLRLSGLADSLVLGARDTASVIASFNEGFDGAPPATFSVSDSAVLRIASFDQLRAIGTGQAWVRAELEGRYDSTLIRVGLPLVPTPVPLVAIGKGIAFGCGLDASGAAWCWGNNQYGQLGDGTFINSDTARRVAGGLTFRSLGVGQSSACAVAIDGTSYCWGENRYGALGQGSLLPERSASPLAIQAPPLWTVAVAGHTSVCGATLADSTVLCWGHNDTWQLGRFPRRASDPTIAPLSNGLQASALAMSSFDGCALDQAGHPWCWGEHFISAWPDSSRALPTRYDATRSYASVVVGQGHSCALTTEGDAYCWGRNERGQLGRGFLGGRFDEPAPVSGSLRFRELIGGGLHTCGLAVVDDRLWCWGESELWIRLGNAVRGQSTAPIEPMPGLRFRAATTRTHEMCAVSLEGATYCW